MPLLPITVYIHVTLQCSEIPNRQSNYKVLKSRRDGMILGMI